MTQLKFAFRTLFKTPFVTAVAVLSLALGIGANAAIFSLFDQMLLRNLPVEQPGELVNISAPGPNPGSQSCNQAGDCEVVFSYPMFRDLESADVSSFEGIAAHRLFSTSLSLDGTSSTGEGLLVSGSYFPVLGLRPTLGRLLMEADDQAIGEHYVAVLSHGYWERELGSDPGVLNKTLIINGHPMTVVGVAPEGFQGTTLGSVPDVFVPISMRGQMEPGWDGFEERRSYWMYVFGRLAPTATPEQARAELNGVYSGIIQEVEAPLQSGMSDQTMERFRAKEIVLEPGYRGQSSMHEDAKTPLTLLFAVTGIVLLIACANVANLLLARGAQRSSEMAIRGSLGASRRQLLGQLLLESVVLALLGGVGSILVASWTLDGMARLLPPEATQAIDFTLQPSVIWFTAALSLGTGLLFGMYPALNASRLDLASVMKENSGKASGARSAARFRSILVTGQIALSMALLVSAGLFLKSLVKVSQIDLGLSTENMVTFSVSPDRIGYDTAQSRVFFPRLEEELSAIPGVTAVTTSLVPVLAGSNWGTDVSVQGFESGPDIDSNSRFNMVGPGYFSTMGMALLSGREFTDADVQGAPKVAVVNQTFLEKFGLDPATAVGSFMSRGGSRGDTLDIEIVGVVQDAKYSSVTQEIPPLFFVPYRQIGTLGFLSYYVRTGVDPSGVMQAIPGVVKSLEPNLPLTQFRTLETQAKESVFLERMISTLAGAFAALATLLAAVGLYGVLAYTVAQRTREIGLRMALGADAGSVRGLVLKQMGILTAVGAVLGLGLAFVVGRGAETLLFGMSGRDPWVMAGSVVLLAFISIGAAYLPALRASRVDPMKALRYE